MSTQTPIVTSKIDGYLVVAGPAAEMESAERVTIESGKFAGETVRLGCRQVWGTGGVTVERIARRLTHPEHGEIVYAYVDVRNGLDDAPMLAAAWAAATQRSINHAASLDAAAQAEEDRLSRD